MNATLLLSAFTIEERKAILNKLENNDLRDILPLKGAHAHSFMVDRIAHDEQTCAQVELNIIYHEPF
jgi:hypothetical protein